MKKILSIVFLALLFGGVYMLKNNDKTVKSHRKTLAEFTPEEHRALHVARTITGRAYYGSLITIDIKGTLKARLMEPFAPDSLFVIYLATNPRSRKVDEIKNNPNVALHYIDEPRAGYVSLYGKAHIVDDDSLKQVIWKEGWERFYPDRDKDYMLIKFEPDYLELISIRDQITGDSLSWQPLKVSFLKD